VPCDHAPLEVVQHNDVSHLVAWNHKGYFVGTGRQPRTKYVYALGEEATCQTEARGKTLSRNEGVQLTDKNRLRL
jgi:hypothetical protein